MTKVIKNDIQICGGFWQDRLELLRYFIDIKWGENEMRGSLISSSEKIRTFKYHDISFRIEPASYDFDAKKHIHVKEVRESNITLCIITNDSDEPYLGFPLEEYRDKKLIIILMNSNINVMEKFLNIKKENRNIIDWIIVKNRPVKVCDKCLLFNTIYSSEENFCTGCKEKIIEYERFLCHICPKCLNKTKTTFENWICNNEECHEYKKLHENIEPFGHKRLMNKIYKHLHPLKYNKTIHWRRKDFIDIKFK